MMRGQRLGAAPDENAHRDRRWRALLASLAIALVLASAPTAAWAIPASDPPTQGEADADDTSAGEVIADGRARLPRGELVWTVRAVDLPSTETSQTSESFPIGFVIVDEGTVELLDEALASQAILEEGEAAFLPGGEGGSLASREGPATYYEIALAPAPDDEPDETLGTVVGDPFAAPEGERFVIELVRNTVTDDEVTIPVSASGAPVFYLTTDGTAQLRSGEQVVDLAAGQFALLAGEVQVRAAGDAPATFVVAAIGAEAARETGARAGRGDRQRVRDGAAQADDAPRARRSRQDRTPRVRTGGGGRQGGGGGQAQQPGPGAPGGGPAPGDPAAPTPPPAGTPPVVLTPEATLPADPTVPADGTPPPEATIPPVEGTETAVPTEPVPPAETPTPVPTVALPPTNPPVPDVPGIPTVPPAEIVPPEEPPAEAPPPVEEPTAAPVDEEAPAPAG